LAIPCSADAETFLDPRIENKYIDACLESYWFQDGCNQAAKNEIAKQFCRWKGYSDWKQWQSYDFG
jgi:hypothetical protein